MENEVSISKPLNKLRAQFNESKKGQSFMHWVFITISFALGVTVLLYVNSTGKPVDVSELTYLVYMFTGTICALIISVRPVLLACQNRAQPLGTIVLQLLVFGILMHHIKSDGDALIELAKQYPTHSIAIGISIVFVLYIYKLGNKSFYVGGNPSAGENYALGIAAKPMAPSKRDIEIARIHEAGHAMIYAAAKPLPSTVEVSVYGTFKGTGSLGGVSSQVTNNTFLRENELNFYMYLTLAGLAAEKAYFNEHASGGSRDLVMWKTYANKYLDGGFSSEVFVVEPQSVQDAELNTTTLKNLSADQMANLEQFFETNYQLLIELADALKKENTLDAEALKPYLERVVLPEWLEPVQLVEDLQDEVVA
ncbi:hypothetical protein QTO17_01325 [Vibrio owensii]